jgi:NADH dehydrogenase
VVGGGAGGSNLSRGWRQARQVWYGAGDAGRPLPTHIWKPLLHEVAAGSMDPNTHQLEYVAQARWHTSNSSKAN